MAQPAMALITPASSFLRRMKQLLQLCSPERWASPTIIILGLASALLEAASLYLFIPLIQSLGAPGGSGGHVGYGLDFLLSHIAPEHRVTILVALVCGMIIAKNLVGFVNRLVARQVEGQVAHRLRMKVFEQTISSCIDYRAQHKQTDVVNTLASETWKVGGALNLLYYVIVNFITGLVFLVLLFSISARLTALAMIFLAAGAVAVHLVTRKADAAGKSVVVENKQFGLRMWESISALQLIRSFAREDYETARLAEKSERVRRRILQLDLLWGLPGPLSEIFGAVLIGLLILGGGMLGSGLAVLAAFLATLYRMQTPVRQIMVSKVALDSLHASVEDVADFLETTKSPHIRSGAKHIEAFERGIEFRDVSFRYAADQRLAVDGISLNIPKGKTTAIVGNSGAGKSTLLRLLFRFEDPAAGEILVDGVPLTELELGGWRSRLALMSQDVQLFNETVEANIAYGDLDAPLERVHRAADIAGAATFIRDLPQGYATELGDRGMRLSGGQRQRIALARTVLRDPDILLLDEATNALDTESERTFQDALETYARGRTVVVIAHRLSTVEHADQIIVLDQGKVVEIGSPATLLRDGGRFARLYGLQFGRLHIHAV